MPNSANAHSAKLHKTKLHQRQNEKNILKVNTPTKEYQHPKLEEEEAEAIEDIPGWPKLLGHIQCRAFSTVKGRNLIACGDVVKIRVACTST